MCWGLLRAICDGGGAGCWRAGIQQVCVHLGVSEITCWGVGLAAESGECRPLGCGLVLGLHLGWVDCSVSGLGMWVECL